MKIHDAIINRYADVLSLEYDESRRTFIRLIIKPNGAVSTPYALDKTDLNRLIDDLTELRDGILT